MSTASFVSLGVARASVATLNHLLAQHVWAKELLAKHEGKAVRLKLALPHLPFLGAPPDFFARVTAEGALSSVTDAQEANVTIELPSFADAAPILIQQGPAALQSLAKVQGDVELAMILGQIFKELRWDPAEDLSRVVGDVAAQSLVQMGQQVSTGAKTVVERSSLELRERLLQTELVERAELEAFQAQLRQLRDSLDRVQQRVALLKGFPVE